MNNDDIYLRKDVYEAKENNLITAINDTKELVNAIDNHVSRELTVLSICVTIITIIVPVILAIFFAR